MKPAPQLYKRTNFRSTLEATWARFFDLVDIPWRYEPLKFFGWIPDSIVEPRDHSPLYIKVKPIAKPLREVASKIGLALDRAGAEVNGAIGYCKSRSATVTTFKRVEEYTVACPTGDAGRIVKDGKQNGRQRCRCKTCGKRFREPDDFQESRRFPVQQVGAALQWYFDGLSYREVARNLGRTLRTDQLRSYGPAVWRVFGGSVKHLESDGMRSEIHNNLSERLQGTIRERDKVLRAIKTQETGQNFLDGWAIDYNLLRPRLGLKRKTPAKAARYGSPFADWQDVAQTVEPILKPNRTARHSAQERKEPLFRTRRSRNERHHL